MEILFLCLLRMDIDIQIAQINANEVKRVQRHDEKVQKLQKTISYYQQQMKFHTDNLSTLETNHTLLLNLLTQEKQRLLVLKKKRGLRDRFQGFKEARLRVSPGVNTHFYEITSAYRQWIEWYSVPGERRLIPKELLECCVDEFGELGGEGNRYLRNVAVLPQEEIE